MALSQGAAVGAPAAPAPSAQSSPSPRANPPLQLRQVIGQLQLRPQLPFLTRGQQFHPADLPHIQPHRVVRNLAIHGGGLRLEPVPLLRGTATLTMDTRYRRCLTSRMVLRSDIGSIFLGNHHVVVGANLNHPASSPSYFSVLCDGRGSISTSSPTPSSIAAIVGNLH